MRQLEETAAGAAPVGAVLYLRPPRGRPAVPSKSIDTVTRSLLDRVATKTGEKPKDYNVFRNLGMFVVVGGREFLRELLKQPEIASAAANRKK